LLCRCDIDLSEVDDDQKYHLELKGGVSKTHPETHNDRLKDRLAQMHEILKEITKGEGKKRLTVRDVERLEDVLVRTSG